MKPTARLLLVATLGTALACVTINVYFPEAKIKDLSEQIEEEVQKKAAEQEATDQAEEPSTTEDPNTAGNSGGSVGLLDALLGVTPVHAQDVPDPGISNPAIRKIIDSRAARAGALNRFKSLGAIGENNRGLVEILKLDAIPDLKDRADCQRLVKAENADREQLYKEIAAAEGVDLSQLPRIRETYAATLRQNARPGDMIQSPDGSWGPK